MTMNSMVSDDRAKAPFVGHPGPWWHLAAAGTLVLALVVGSQRVAQAADSDITHWMRPLDLISDCERTVEEQNGTMGTFKHLGKNWSLRHFGCVLDGAQWGGSGPVFAVEWGRVGDAPANAIETEMAVKKLSHWPWSRVKSNRALASIPLSKAPPRLKKTDRHPFGDRSPASPSEWRQRIYDVFAPLAQNILVNEEAGTMSIFTSGKTIGKYPALLILAGGAERVPGLEITAATATTLTAMGFANSNFKGQIENIRKSNKVNRFFVGWRLDGRLVRAVTSGDRRAPLTEENPS